MGRKRTGAEAPGIALGNRAVGLNLVNPPVIGNAPFELSGLGLFFRDFAQRGQVSRIGAEIHFVSR